MTQTEAVSVSDTDETARTIQYKMHLVQYLGNDTQEEVVGALLLSYHFHMMLDYRIVVLILHSSLISGICDETQKAHVPAAGFS